VRLRHRRPVLAISGVAVLLALGACAGLPGAQLPSATVVPGVGSAPPAAAGAVDASTWATKWGPLSAADRELITKVRLATLWEMVMAQQATQRASTARVRQISAEIAAQHHVLDEKGLALAAKLKVELPIKPTDLQQEWMADISSRSGKQYDSTYVKWLRLAHGQIFALIGAVRGSTQNTLVRSFSEQANAAVLNHQRLLESTGLVNPEAFPSPPAA
jgi:predicted outer membrane protein